MKHKGTVPIETDRLILRRFTEADAPAMFANWAGDEEVVKYLTWPAHENIEASRRYITDVRLPGYEDPACYQWGIELKSLGQVIGSIGTVSFSESAESVHIGYCLGRQWWHQGIMTEALSAVIHFFFSQVGANRVESRHDPHNPHSGMVMRKCGMTYEGTLHLSDRNNQGLCDAAWYGILRSDYNL